MICTFLKCILHPKFSCTHLLKRWPKSSIQLWVKVSNAQLENVSVLRRMLPLSRCWLHCSCSTRPVRPSPVTTPRPLSASSTSLRWKIKHGWRIKNQLRKQQLSYHRLHSSDPTTQDCRAWRSDRLFSVLKIDHHLIWNKYILLFTFCFQWNFNGMQSLWRNRTLRLRSLFSFGRSLLSVLFLHSVDGLLIDIPVVLCLVCNARNNKIPLCLCTHKTHDEKNCVELLRGKWLCS